MHLAALLAGNGKTNPIQDSSFRGSFLYRLASGRLLFPLRASAPAIPAPCRLSARSATLGVVLHVRQAMWTQASCSSACRTSPRWVAPLVRSVSPCAASEDLLLLGKGILLCGEDFGLAWWSLRLPASGCRNRTSGTLVVVGGEGYSYSSSPYASGYVYAGGLYFYASCVNPMSDYSRANGLPVRCVRGFATTWKKDENMLTMSTT